MLPYCNGLHFLKNAIQSITRPHCNFFTSVSFHFFPNYDSKNSIKYYLHQSFNFKKSLNEFVIHISLFQKRFKRYSLRYTIPNTLVDATFQHKE